MTEGNTSSADLADRTIVFTREFNAPRELVFQAWTEPQHLAQWWGPKGWTLPICNVDLRPGGVWHYCMRGPAGEDAWGKAIYEEIVAPERLVYRDMFSDAAGNAVEGMPQSHVTVNFVERDGKTTTTMTAIFPTREARDTVLKMGMNEGIAESFNRLDAHLLKVA